MTSEVVVNASASLSDDPEQMWPVDSLEFCCNVQPCHPTEDAGRLSVSYGSHARCRPPQRQETQNFVLDQNGAWLAPQTY